MGTFVKTKSDTWKALVRRQGWPTISKTFRTKRDAIDWARRTEDEMVRGVFILRTASERTTFSQAMTRYLAEVSSTKKPKTQISEERTARLLKQYFGKYSLAAISAEQVAAYRDKRLSEGRSNNTVRIELALLRHLYTTAIREWGMGLTVNPVSNIRKPSPGAGRNRRLFLEEQKKLFEAIDQHSNPMVGWIVRIAIETGMRQSEILELRLSQVDLERRVVRLIDTKNDDSRMVPLTRLATDVFAAALANPARPSDVDLVFLGEPGRDGIRRRYEFLRTWRIIKMKLGMADLRFHDLRHEAVSRLVEAGLSDQEVASISGHKSMQMLRQYTHLRTEDLVEKLDRINAA